LGGLAREGITSLAVVRPDRLTTALPESHELSRHLAYAEAGVSEIALESSWFFDRCVEPLGHIRTEHIEKRHAFPQIISYLGIIPFHEVLYVRRNRKFLSGLSPTSRAKLMSPSLHK
jgi:hypothetical protein